MRRLVGVLGMLVALAFAGCGSDADRGAPLEVAEPLELPQGSTPRAEYVDRVNEICSLRGSGIVQQITKDLDAARAQGKTFGDAVGVALANSLPAQEEWQSQIYEIPPPPGDREELERYWGYTAQAFETTEEFMDAYLARDRERVEELDEALDQQESANEFAKGYGIGKCSGFTDSEAEQFDRQIKEADPSYGL